MTPPTRKLSGTAFATLLLIALMLGNGSDELISLLSMACDVPGACVLAPVPGFVMYGISAQLQGLQFIGVPLTPDFELDEAAMLTASRRSCSAWSSGSLISLRRIMPTF